MNNPYKFIISTKPLKFLLILLLN